MEEWGKRERVMDNGDSHIATHKPHINARTYSVCFRVVPAYSSSKMFAQFLPRMHNEYLNNPNFIIIFYSRELSGNHSSRSGTTNAI